MQINLIISLMSYRNTLKKIWAISLENLKIIKSINVVYNKRHHKNNAEFQA